MAATNEYGLFWDSNNGDRVYNAESFELWLKKFFYSGVFANEFDTSPTSGMGISVTGGYVNVDGKVKFFENSSFTLSAASASYPRYDAIVIERNDTNRNITIKTVTGAYSGSSPQKPAPVRTGGVYQLVVAYIYIPAGATAITQAQIIDSRGDSNVCGYVTGTVDQLDFDSLMNQFNAWLTEQQDDFDTWFDNMKGQLSTDAAGHLQSEIDDINKFFVADVTGEFGPSGGNYSILVDGADIVVGSDTYKAVALLQFYCAGWRTLNMKYCGVSGPVRTTGYMTPDIVNQFTVYVNSDHYGEMFTHTCKLLYMKDNT